MCNLIQIFLSLVSAQLEEDIQNISFKQLLEYIPRELQADGIFLGQLLNQSKVAATSGGRSHAPASVQAKSVLHTTSGSSRQKQSSDRL